MRRSSTRDPIPPGPGERTVARPQGLPFETYRILRDVTGKDLNPPQQVKSRFLALSNDRRRMLFSRDCEGTFDLFVSTMGEYSPTHSWTGKWRTCAIDLAEKETCRLDLKPNAKTAPFWSGDG